MWVSGHFTAVCGVVFGMVVKTEVGAGLSELLGRVMNSRTLEAKEHDSQSWLSH